MGKLVEAMCVQYNGVNNNQDKWIEHNVQPRRVIKESPRLTALWNPESLAWIRAEEWRSFMKKVSIPRTWIYSWGSKVPEAGDKYKQSKKIKGDNWKLEKEKKENKKTQEQSS